MDSGPHEYPDVGGFAATLNSQIATRSRLAKATGFAWLCGGGAIAACLAGGGLALAFAGYSHMISVQPAADIVAKALVDALQRTKLKTQISGTVSLSPDSQLRIADGQSVKLDQNTIVKLDPASSVRVVGDLKIDVPQPSKEQLQPDATSNSNDLPFTDYTIFRDVAYSTGQVVSGWSYDLSDTTHPKFQYCYFTQNIERGLATKYILAVNGSMRPPSSSARPSFDFDGAVANCSWFSGY